MRCFFSFLIFNQINFNFYLKRINANEAKASETKASQMNWNRAGEDHL